LNPLKYDDKSKRREVKREDVVVTKTKTKKAAASKKRKVTGTPHKIKQRRGKKT
jgi:hypothetical protein